MNKTSKMVMVAIFTSLTAIGGFIRIPLPFVPITLQTFFVLMAGIILGKKSGALSQLLYVALGLIGIPIFAGGGGIASIFHPSFGYLLGFIVAAFTVGLLLEKKQVDFRNTLLVSVVGMAVVYLFGVPYLYFVLNQVTGMEISLFTAIKTGMLVFLPGDLLKVFILTSIVPDIYKRINPEKQNKLASAR
ncbi:MAG: biotin transporter BioY [Halanaerobiales bacterium]|nr:biotin transporter BioY [Halanaerobiales bacterium]